MDDFDRDSMFETFIYEMNQMIEQLENNTVLAEDGFSASAINEIFRIMHTIKGSSAMMLYDTISVAAHAIEDLFYYLRESKPANVDYSKVTDLTLEVGDFIKAEIEKLENGRAADGQSQDIIGRIEKFVTQLKKDNGEKVQKPKSAPKSGVSRKYHAVVFFHENSEMENIRAYTLVHNMSAIATNIIHVPINLLDDSCAVLIKKNGFVMDFSSPHSLEEIRAEIMKGIYVKELKLTETKDGEENQDANDNKDTPYCEYEAIVKFENGCEMENIRAYGLVHNLLNDVLSVEHYPEDLIDEGAISTIKTDGLYLKIVTDKEYDELYSILNSTIYLESLFLRLLDDTNDKGTSEPQDDEFADEEDEENYVLDNIKEKVAPIAAQEDKMNKNLEIDMGQAAKKTTSQYAISVNVQKLDLLLNLVGELVTSEAMVTQNPDLDGLNLESFNKESSQLRKIIKDVQDTVMSMRMVPLSPTFFKMHRIVRDMCKQLGKEVQLEIIGENTEVDKNIIEHISDPIMHIIRNSVDHGIETPEIREKKGKNPKGVVTLEAKHAGGDVLICVKDDGAGFDRDRILAKAKQQGILTKPENELTDKEIYNFILLPGFTTNDKVTEYSGRGVGMDVVTNNIEMVGGTVIADSVPNKGSMFTLKIPLTLAIIEGMLIKIGNTKYTIPIVSIIRSFKAKKSDMVIDPNGNEMIMVRGECYNLVRLKNEFRLDFGYDDIEDGIVMMLENGTAKICVFADELLGEQQVVVKNIPKYIKRVRGISGCTILGNGDISLIIDVVGFFDN